MAAKAGHPVTPAASIRPGYHVAYPVMVDGKEVLSRGEVLNVRRVSHNKIEIVLLHHKTGALFTNVLKGSSPVLLTSVTFDPEQDAVTKMLAEQLAKLLKQQASDFYTVMEIES